MKQTLLWLLSGMLMTAASAAPLPCGSGSLADYIAAYGGPSAGCVVGNATFSNFHFASTGSVVLTSSNIQVQVVQGASEGLNFSGPLTANSGTSLDALISFLISASSLTGESLSMANPVVTGGGSATTAESICFGTLSAGGICSGSTESLDAFATATASNSSSTVGFPTGTTTATVTKNIILQGGAGSGSSASIMGVSNTVTSGSGGAGPGGTPVPEPEPLLLLGAGLIGVALIMRQARARA